MDRIKTDEERRAALVPLDVRPDDPALVPAALDHIAAALGVEPLCADCFPVLTCSGHAKDAAA